MKKLLLLFLLVGSLASFGQHVEDQIKFKIHNPCDRTVKVLIYEYVWYIKPGETTSISVDKELYSVAIRWVNLEGNYRYMGTPEMAEGETKEIRSCE